MTWNHQYKECITKNLMYVYLLHHGHHLTAIKVMKNTRTVSQNYIVSSPNNKQVQSEKDTNEADLFSKWMSSERDRRLRLQLSGLKSLLPPWRRHTVLLTSFQAQRTAKACRFHTSDLRTHTSRSSLSLEATQLQTETGPRVFQQWNRRYTYTIHNACLLHLRSF